MPSSIDIASGCAVQLSLTEIGLGSFLHAFHIPFAGFFLSLNQCFVLNRAIMRPLFIFFGSAVSTDGYLEHSSHRQDTKPLWKKFTPMLAISIQGLLFNLGVIFFGNNLFGRCIGSLLLSLWPMIQPALIYGIIYADFLSMGAYYNQMITKLPWFNDMTLLKFLRI